MSATDEREFLLRSLPTSTPRRAAGDIEPSDYATLRDDYTARAAAALRGDDRPAASAGAASVARRSPAWPLLAVVAGLVVGNAAGAARCRASGHGIDRARRRPTGWPRRAS